MQLEAVFQAKVINHSNLWRDFRIVEGRGVDPRAIANLYNRVLGPLEKNMVVTPEQIEARLAVDRRSVYVGFVDAVSNPVSLINVVRRPDTTVPDTHQELTDQELFSSAMENGALAWFCPWVAVHPEMRGFSLVEGDQKTSLGQLHVLQVKRDALQDSAAQKLYAYSRPMAIRLFLGRYGNPVDTEIGRTRPHFCIDGDRLRLTTEGIAWSETGERFFTMQEYWDAQRPDKPGKQFDPVFYFHASMGAEFRPDLVKAFGQRHDLLSLAYRTPLEYDLAK